MRRKLILSSLVFALLTGAAFSQEEKASKGIFLSSRQEFKDGLDRLIASRNVRGSLRGPYRCEATQRGGGELYFCEYSLLYSRPRLWSTSENTPVEFVTARIRPEHIGAASMLGLAFLIIAIEGNISDGDATSMAEQLISANRTISGKVTIAGKQARYESLFDRDGLHFIAMP